MLKKVLILRLEGTNDGSQIKRKKDDELTNGFYRE